MSKKRKSQHGGTGGRSDNAQPSKKPKVQPTSRGLVKRAKDYSSADADFAVLFEGLSSEHNQQRYDASQAFVSKCAAVFANGASDPLHDFLDLQKPRNVYTRLLRGTCSTAKKSRAGFSTTLSRLIEQQIYGDHLPDAALDLVVEHTQPGQDALRSEKRECLVGRMTAYDALLQAGLFSQSSGKTVDPRFIKLTDAMCELVSNAPHVLKDLCGAAFCRAIGTLAGKGASSECSKAIVQSICSHDLARTPEGIAVWLEVTEKVPDVKLPSNFWHHRDPLSKQDRPAVLKILRKGNDVSEEDSSKEKDTSGRREAEPSFAWNVLLRHLARRSSAALSAGKSDPYSDFWIEAVDNTFFAEKASDNRKSLGFQIFTNQLDDTTQPVNSGAFSSKLLQCLQNQCSSASSKVFSPAKGAVRAMEARAKKDPDAAPIILQALAIRPEKFVDFDAVVSASGVKVIQGILKSSTDSVMAIIARNLAIIKVYSSTNAEKEQAKYEEDVAGFVLQAIRLRKQSLSDSVVSQKSWSFLMVHLLFRWICDSESKSTDAVKTRFLSCVAELVACCPRGAVTLPTDLILGQRQSTAASITSIAQAPESIKKTEVKAVKVLQKLNKALESPLSKGFRLLLSMTLLQVYTGDAEATELLGDLYKSYNDAWETSEPATGSTDTIIEILISFASKPSLPRRKLSEIVFPDFATGMSLEALTSMTDVLAQPESVTGQKALFDEGPDEDEADSEEAAIDGDDSDVEMGSDVEEADDALSDDSVSNAGSDSSDASANSADQRLDEALGSLFGTNNTTAAATKPANGTAGATSDSDSDSDSSMDDEQMLALEPQLAQAFKQRADARGGSNAPPSRKKAHAAARQTMLDFKNRTLDLLSLFLRASPAHPLSPHTILPLLRAIRLTKAPQVADKAARTLASFFDAAKSRGLPAMLPAGADNEDSVDLDALLAAPPPGLAPARSLPPAARAVFAALVAVHAEALRFASKRHAAACSRASLFLARCLLAAQDVERGAARELVAYLYVHTQLRRAGGPLLPLHFFTDFVDFDAAVSGAA